MKLSSVATDVMGVSGWALMQAIIGGQADPEALAELARGKLRALRKALTARFRGHHAFLLERMLPTWTTWSATSSPSASG